jgi:hypothetical protein
MTVASNFSIDTFATGDPHPRRARAATPTTAPAGERDGFFHVALSGRAFVEPKLSSKNPRRFRGIIPDTHSDQRHIDRYFRFCHGDGR